MKKVRKGPILQSQTTEKLLKRSQFLKFYKRNNNYCLFHSLTLRKVYGGQILKSLYDCFESPVTTEEAASHLAQQYPDVDLGHIISELREKGLIVTDGYQDAHIYKKLFLDGLNQHLIRHMYILPTNVCNFKCKYCFVEDEARHLKPAYMSEETAKKGIDVFAKLTEKSDAISLVFYGGEPLLNADVVYSTMRYVRSKEKDGAFKKPVSMSLLTNGSLVDEKTVEAVLETKTSVSISIDGPKKLHDGARISVDDSGTYDRALAAFRLLQKAGVGPGISCTINESNIHHVEDIARFIIEDLKPSGVGFNILLPKMGKSEPGDYSYEYAAEQLIKAFEMLRKAGIYEDRIMRRVKPFVNNGFHFKDCMGVGGQIVLTPQGTIGPCQAYLGCDEYFPINVDDLYRQIRTLTFENIYGNPLFYEWLYRFPLNMEECANCEAISICGGGCPYASEVTHGSIWKIDERVCHQAKKTMEWMIWDTYKNYRQFLKNQSQPRQFSEPVTPDGIMEEWFKRKFYDDVSDIRKERNGYYKHYVHNFVTHFFDAEKIKGKKILDFGCGPGFYSTIFAREGAKVAGIDKSGFLIDKANYLKNKYHLDNVEFIKGDFNKMAPDWQPEQFDYVIAIDTFVSFDYEKGRHDHEQVSKAFGNIKRIMKDDARCYVIESHPCWGQLSTNISLGDDGEYFINRLPDYKIEYKHEGFPHHWFTLEEMTRATSENGLAIIRIYEPDPAEEMEKEYGSEYLFHKKYPGMIVYEIGKMSFGIEAHKKDQDA